MALRDEHPVVHTGEVWIVFDPGKGWTIYHSFMQRWAERHHVDLDVFHDIAGYTFFENFDGIELVTIIEVIRVARARFPSLPMMSVRARNNRYLWRERDHLHDDQLGVQSIPQEVKNMSDIEQPLHIPRQALIDTLQGRLDEEQAKRQKAEDEKKANRQRVTDAVMSLSQDELVNSVVAMIPMTSATDVVQWIEKAKEEGRFKSQETKPTSTENSLDKLVRVLTLSNDDTIEVTPADSVYNLL